MGELNVNLTTKLREYLDPLSSRARIEWRVDDEAVSSADVSPFRQDACAFSVLWSCHEIVLSLSEHARLELDVDQSSVDLLDRLIAAIVAGRVLRQGRGRTEAFRVAIGGDQEDEEVVIVDLPNWSRRQRDVNYFQPY